MSQKKTVFERLEDKMIELQQNIDSQLNNIQAQIENLKEEIPRSIGQNLLQFADMIGAKIEDIEDAINKISTSTSTTPDTSAISALQTSLNDIKTELNKLSNDIKNIKIEIPSVPAPTTPSTAAPAPSPTTPPKRTPPVVTPPVTITPPTTPSPTQASQTPSTAPTSTPSVSSTPSAAAPTTPPPQEGPLAEVIRLLDTIKEKARSNLSAIQLANEMEQIRDTIVKIFRWHPALYELATFARRLKKSPEGTGLDAETQSLLIEKVDEWKNRISSS